MLNTHIVCLLETRVKENKSRSIIDRHFQRWSMLHNYVSAYNGRIWILWKDQVQVEVIDSTDQCITCSISFDTYQFHLSAVYGLNEGGARRRLWENLRNMHVSLAQKPWILAGDFNVVANPSESSNHNSFQVNSSDIKEFTECLLNLSLQDHAFTGPLFTSTNRQGEGFLAKKLDRVLINDHWLLAYTQSTVEFLFPGESDHCPAYIKISQDFYSPLKPFKFFNFWTKHPDFLRVVESSWNESAIGSSMKVLHMKLKRLKRCLKNLNTCNYADITGRVKAKRNELAEVQLLNLTSHSNADSVELEKMWHWNFMNSC